MVYGKPVKGPERRTPAISDRENRASNREGEDSRSKITGEEMEALAQAEADERAANREVAKESAEIAVEDVGQVEQIKEAMGTTEAAKEAAAYEQAKAALEVLRAALEEKKAAYDKLPWYNPGRGLKAEMQQLNDQIDDQEAITGPIEGAMEAQKAVPLTAEEAAGTDTGSKLGSGGARRGAGGGTGGFGKR